MLRNHYFVGHNFYMFHNFAFFFVQIIFTFALQFECTAPLSVSLELYRLSLVCFVLRVL